MPGVVEASSPGWAEVSERVLWVLPLLASLGGALLFPWPKGVRCRALMLGLMLSLIWQLYEALMFFGVFGPPRYNYEEEIPSWLETVDLVMWVALGMGGMILVTVGAWLAARGVVRAVGEVVGGTGGRHA